VRLAPWKVALFVLGVLVLLALSLPSHDELGWAYLARHEYAQARASFMAQLRDDPLDSRSWLGLAEVHGALGDSGRQIATLETASRRFPRELPIRRQLADVYEWNKDFDGTTRTLERLAAGERQNNVVTLRRLLNFYHWLSRYDAALVVLRHLERLRPTDPEAVDDMVTLARAAHRQDEAITILETYTAQRPRDAEFQRRLAEMYEATGQVERARERWHTVARLVPGDPEAAAQLASSSEATLRAEIDLLERARTDNLGDEAARLRLAQIYRGLGEPRALAVQRELVDLRPTDHDRLVALGEMLVQAGRAGEAVTYYERATAVAPESVKTALALVQLYEWTNQPRRALDLLEPIAVTRPGDRTLTERVAQLARGAGETDRALVVLDRLAREFPQEPRYQRQAVDLLIAADRAPDAIPRLERLVARSPDDVEPALLLAQLYEWTSQPQRALAVVARLATARPGDRALAERAASLAEAAGSSDRSLALLETLARQHPDDVQLALRLAQHYEWAGREAEAISVYETLDRTGVLPEALLLRLSDLYRFQSRPADFLRVAERLLARRPDDVALRQSAVETGVGLGRGDQVVRLLAPLVERHPRDAEIVLQYLTVAAQSGRLEEGLRAHQRLLGSSPPPAYRAKAAQVLTDAGQHPEAIAEWEAFLAVSGERSDSDSVIRARLALAQLYEWTDASERALGQWEAVMLARPHDLAVLRQVGRLSLGLDRTETALRAYRGLVTQKPDDPEALKRLGQLLAWSHDPRAAKPLLERFNRVKGGDYEVHFLLGEIYTLEKDDARARAEYDRALSLLPPRSSTH
jgi:tetratricopeptide (TPR) repeat protein